MLFKFHEGNIVPLMFNQLNIYQPKEKWKTGKKSFVENALWHMCLTCSSWQREGQVEAGVMTASAHRGDEKEEETKGVSNSERRALIFPNPQYLFFPRLILPFPRETGGTSNWDPTVCQATNARNLILTWPSELWIKTFYSLFPQFSVLCAFFKESVPNYKH